MANNSNPFAANYGVTISPLGNGVDFISYPGSYGEGIPSIKTIDGRIGYFLPVPYKIGAGAAWQADGAKARARGGVPYTARQKNQSVSAQMTGRFEVVTVSGWFFPTKVALSDVAEYVEWKSSSWWQDQGLALAAIAAAPFVVPIVASAAAPNVGVQLPSIAGGTMGSTSGSVLSSASPSALGAIDSLKSVVGKIPTSLSEFKDTAKALNIAASDIGKTAAGIASVGAGLKTAITGPSEVVDNAPVFVDSVNTAESVAIGPVPIAVGLGILSLLFLGV